MIDRLSISPHRLIFYSLYLSLYLLLSIYPILSYPILSPLLRHSTTECALKKLKKQEHKAEFEREASLLMRLNHPNVVRCLGIYVEVPASPLASSTSLPLVSSQYMVMEYLSKGSLVDFLKRPDVKNKLSFTNMLHM